MLDDFSAVLLSGVTGKFLLTASVTAPNSCFEAGEITKGAPGGDIEIPEDLHFQFKLKVKASMFCLQVMTGVSFVRELDPRELEGHHRIIAHLMLNGAILAQKALVFPSKAEEPSLIPLGKAAVIPDFARFLTPVGFNPVAWDGNLPWPLRIAKLGLT